MSVKSSWVLLLVLLAAVASPAHGATVSIPLVTVGDPGNVADADGLRVRAVRVPDGRVRRDYGPVHGFLELGCDLRRPLRALPTPTGSTTPAWLPRV